MCGRFAQVFEDKDVSRIEEILRAAIKVSDQDPLIETFNECFNIAPTQNALIARSSDSQSNSTHAQLDLARFGLIPSWSKDLNQQATMNNARRETIYEKPSYRGLIRSRRCLIPMNGFFEWQSIPGERTKRPWYISRADHDVLMLGGVWDSWIDREHGDTQIDSFSIVTRESNEFMSPIHHRMPVVIEPAMAGDWIDPNTAQDQIHQMMLDPTDGTLRSHRVSKRVNSVVHDDPALLEPIIKEDGEQGMLFG
ncbi:MAG: SOS response-associated peptidase [Phycisphaerales bacterium]